MSHRRKRSKGSRTNPVVDARIIKSGCGGGAMPTRKRDIGETARRNAENAPLMRFNRKEYNMKCDMLAAAAARKAAHKAKAREAHARWLLDQAAAVRREAKAMNTDWICEAHERAPEHVINRIHKDSHLENYL